MPPSFLRFAFVAVVLFSIACSGGGDETGAAITATSAPSIATAAMLGCSLSADAADVAAAALPDMSEEAARVEAPTRGGSEAPVFATRAPFGPDIELCFVDGQVTFTGDVDDPAMYKAGDVVNADFELCDEGAEGIFDGSLTLTILSLVGDILGAAFDATLDLLVTQLSFTKDADTFTFDGDGVLDVDTMVAQVTDTALAGDVLNVDDGSESITLRDYTTNLVVDNSGDPDVYTLSAAGRLSSSLFPGEVTYETTEDFMGTVDAHPDTGTMLITGASNAKIWLVAIDDTNVRLDIDLNGDDSIDAAVDTTWDQLGL